MKAMGASRFTTLLLLKKKKKEMANDFWHALLKCMFKYMLLLLQKHNRTKTQDKEWIKLNYKVRRNGLRLNYMRVLLLLSKQRKHQKKEEK